MQQYTSLPWQERFWPKVIIRDPLECWDWSGAKDSGGYGQLVIRTGKRQGETRLVERAHRLMLQIFIGPPPPGLCALHECDNPPCCNPLHLHYGTHHRNMKEMVEHGRSMQGERHPLAKLDGEAVLKIRTAATNGAPLSVLATQNGVTEGCIRLIVSRRRWRHI